MLSLFFAISTSAATTVEHSPIKTYDYKLSGKFKSSSDAAKAFSQFFLTDHVTKKINEVMVSGKTKCEIPLTTHKSSYKNGILTYDAYYGVFTYTKNNDGTFSIDAKIKKVAGTDKFTTHHLLTSAETFNLYNRMKSQMDAARDSFAPHKFE